MRSGKVEVGRSYARAMTTAHYLGLAGFLLWWGGYYAAMTVAWRAGFRQLGVMIAAAAAGVCGCFGIPIIAYFWAKVQSKTYATIIDGPDDAPVPPHMRHYQVAVGIAIVGMVLQVVASRMMD